MHWHIYQQEQIKPELRGRLKLVLEISGKPGVPVIRDIYDPSGQEFPSSKPTIEAEAFQNRSNGIVFDGVNKAAVYGTVMRDPRILRGDSDYVGYNRAVIENSLGFLLREQYLRPEVLPQPVLSVAGEEQGMA